MDNKNNLNDDFDTGISSNVFTVKSNIKLIDIFNNIIQKKATAIFNWIDCEINGKNNFSLSKDSSIIIVGSYLTGIGIAKLLAKNSYSNICLIDIYPHLSDLIDLAIASSLNDSEKEKINFSSDLSLINKSTDIFIDTTGFGGLNIEQSAEIKSKLFLIEDPVAEDNDFLLKTKNNIFQRADIANSDFKAILKTKGLNTKTSGTMTFSIEVLRRAITNALETEGVLYSACEMTFFEEIIFKEKDLNKFLELANLPALKVSTISLFDIDDLIKNSLNKINSEIINYKN